GLEGADDLAVFLFQADDGIRDRNVTGVQTCALPISANHSQQTTGTSIIFQAAFLHHICHTIFSLTAQKCTAVQEIADQVTKNVSDRPSHCIRDFSIGGASRTSLCYILSSCTHSVIQFTINFYLNIAAYILQQVIHLVCAD